jgi:hypothetical protein
MKKIILPLLTTFMLSILSSVLLGQDYDPNVLKYYDNVGLYIDQQIEVSNTFLSTPFTSINVSNEIEKNLTNNSIPFTRKFSNSGSPVLFFRIVPSVTVNSECTGKSYAIDVRVYETINGKRVITYCRVFDCLTVNHGPDPTADILWKQLREGLNYFIRDWKSSH